MTENKLTYEKVGNTTVQQYDKEKKESFGNKFIASIMKRSDGITFITLTDLTNDVDYGMSRVFPVAKCEECGKSISDFDKHCRHCGKGNKNFKE